MKLRSKMKKIFCAAAIAVMILTLSSCTYPFSDAALEFKATESGANIPQISGIIKSEEVNEQLSEIFTPYADRAQKAVSDSNGKLKIFYNMTESEDSSAFSPEYNISMKISDGSDSIDIMSAEVSGFSDVSADVPTEASWLSSADVITSVLSLHRAGLDVDLSKMSGAADEKFAVEFFIDLYEAFAGKELDVSDIATGDILGDEHKKALKLELVTAYADPNNYEYSTQADWSMVLNLSSVLLTDIERDVYGRQSESVTGEEFTDIIRAMYNVCIAEEIEGYEQRWEDLGAVDFSAVVSDINKAESELNRRDGAEILFRITTAGPDYNVNYNDYGLNYVDDSDSIWVRRAVTYSFMGYYGESVVFAPKQGLTVTNAITTAKTYICARYSHWLGAVNYEFDGLYDKYDVIVAAGKIAEYFEGRPSEQKNSFETKTVINDRDYDWFYSQNNTGEYSSVNCMPSIATMAAHWYNEQSSATVQKMRNTSDITAGWTASELRMGLECYNVPYEVVSANMENILEALDEGKIILAQYSDRPIDQSGHCYVIYGYRKFNNSVTFIVNDSDSLSDRAQIFGRLKGNGDELEANFALWSIKRFVSDVTVVG